MYISQSSRSPALGALAGKRVKKFLQAQAAQVAAAQAAAAAPGATEEAKQRAEQLLREQAATHESYMAKQATKKRGFKGALEKFKEVRAKVDPVARTQEFQKAVKKHGFKGAWEREVEKEKAAHLKATHAMSKISPSFKKHYKFEAGKFEAKDLKRQLAEIQAQRAAGDSPLLQEREAAIIARLQELGREQKKYIKQGKIAAAIATVIVSVFTFGAGGGLIAQGMNAIKQGAVALGKKLIAGAVATALVQKSDGKIPPEAAAVVGEAVAGHAGDTGQAPTQEVAAQLAQAALATYQQREMMKIQPAGPVGYEAGQPDYYAPPAPPPAAGQETGTPAEPAAGGKALPWLLIPLGLLLFGG